MSNRPAGTEAWAAGGFLGGVVFLAGLTALAYLRGRAAPPCAPQVYVLDRPAPLIDLAARCPAGTVAGIDIRPLGIGGNDVWVLTCDFLGATP